MSGGEQYIENEEKRDFPDFDLVHKRFEKSGTIKAESQIRMYKSISNVWAVGKIVVDVGCGIGVGSNILGWNALGVYGVDSNPKNVSVARQLYESPTIKFDEYDILNPPERPIATADIVTCIEVIEHVKDYDLFLDNLKKFHDNKRRTVFFISSPNRNSENLKQDRPRNEYHVREWQAGEFYDVLTRHFKSVVLYDAQILDTFEIEETVDGNSKSTPILAKVEGIL